jgi:hypothetical protein
MLKLKAQAEFEIEVTKEFNAGGSSSMLSKFSRMK